MSKNEFNNQSGHSMKGEKMYTYFVSYNFRKEEYHQSVTGFGYIVLPLNKPINSSEDIFSVINVIKKQRNFEDVVILYFQELKE